MIIMRILDVPSTAHRADGQRVPRVRIVGSKRPRELGSPELHAAIAAVQAEQAEASAAPDGASDRPGGGCGDRRLSGGQPPKADIST